MAEDWTFIEIGRLAKDGDQIAQLYETALAMLDEFTANVIGEIHAEIVKRAKLAYGDPSKNS